jgi:hypothetical protein
VTAGQVRPTSSSHHDEGQPRLPLGGVGFQLGHLERPEDLTAQLQRVIDRFHSQRVNREVVMTEI